MTAALLAVALLVPQAAPACALRGAVLDGTGAPLPQVAVALTSTALHEARTVRTAADGTYAFLSLPPGDYHIVFELTSFERLERDLRIPLGATAVQNAVLTPRGAIGAVGIEGRRPARSAVLTSPGVAGLNVRQDEVSLLPASRTLLGIATLAPAVSEHVPNTGQLAIGGAFAYDNLFVVNGVEVGDNRFGSPQSLFIEDAIEETMILAAGIPAEFGRFSGGVVSAVTRSGGNRIGGSYRLNVSNPAWTTETPLDADRGIAYTSRFDFVHEGTLGGPVVRNRLWFFAAGRLARVHASEASHRSGERYTGHDNSARGELKLTAAIAAGHRAQAGTMISHRELKDVPSFAFSLDRSSARSERQPNWYAYAAYRSAPGSRLLLESQYSERRFALIGRGGAGQAIRDSPFFTLFGELGHYNAPYFDPTDPERRNGRQFGATVSAIVRAAGSHHVKAGYGFAGSRQMGGGSQSVTGYVFDADYAADAAGRPLLDAEGRLVPVFAAGAALLEHWMATRGAVLNVDVRSAFVQDRWTAGPHVSADVGMRYEATRSAATGSPESVDARTLEPRAALSYDPYGDGRTLVRGTFALYAGRYGEHLIADSRVGQPDRTIGVYVGPPGEGRTFAPGFDPGNYRIFSGLFPSANVRLDPQLARPTTRELTISVARSAAAAHGEAALISRETTGLIEDFVTTANGETVVERDGVHFGAFTNVIYRNSDLPQRRYLALALRGRYRAGSQWMIEGSWTMQLKNTGNYEGERPNRPGAPSALGNFPEGFDPTRVEPSGRLRGFERHRARIWTVYQRTAGGGDLSISGLIRADSGAVYSLVAANQPLTPVQQNRLAAYADRPLAQNVYFGSRGAASFPGIVLLDASVTYALRLLGRARPWAKLEVFNLLNTQTAIRFNTTVFQDPAAPRDALGLATAYVQGPAFGRPQDRLSFPSSAGASGGRTARLALGLRF
jgi:hypothetical protein